ncbi:hypothetical protein B0H13DRAFT_882595 [Mycena leptocephala]|nr:hypothetical protein B0H13DRAFT_882595 [Mycena leptocephala]
MPPTSLSETACITIYTGISSTIFMARYVAERRLKEDGSDMPLLAHRAHKRRRLEDTDGIMIIPNQDLKLVRQIGSGSGYFLHAGQNNGHAVIVKVFNRGRTVRQQLESTVALSKDVLHPNVLRIEGISSPASLIHFIAYEDVFWKMAEGPLAAALKNDLQRSITLGFKMIEGLSVGLGSCVLSGT